MDKLALTTLINRLSPEHRRVVERIILKHAETIRVIPGSRTKHQTWEGGYIAHLEETMNIALALFATLSMLRPLPFKESDALFTLFLHDYDKLISYTKNNGVTIRSGDYGHAHTVSMERIATTWGYSLTDHERNALEYVHGEGADYHPTQRIMQPLAAFIHCCDIISARIWFDYGRRHDSWEE